MIPLEVNVLEGGSPLERREEDECRPRFVKALDGIEGYDPLSIRIVCEPC